MYKIMYIQIVHSAIAVGRIVAVLFYILPPFCQLNFQRRASCNGHLYIKVLLKSNLMIWFSDDLSILYYSRRIWNILGKPRNQNLKEALLKCLVSTTLENLVILMLHNEKQIPKVSKFYIFRTLFNAILNFFCIILWV